MKTLERKVSIKGGLSPKKTLDNSLPDLSQHPIVVKKVEEAREFLRTHPIPKDLKW